MLFRKKINSSSILFHRITPIPTQINHTFLLLTKCLQRSNSLTKISPGKRKKHIFCIKNQQLNKFCFNNFYL